MSQGKIYAFQRQGLEDTIISVIRGQGKSGNFFLKLCIHPARDICNITGLIFGGLIFGGGLYSGGAYIRDFTVSICVCIV